MARNLCAVRWAFPLFLGLAGLLLFYPALRSPFVLDDYLQASMAHGVYPVPRKAWDLYNFIDLNDANVLKDRGFLPWWSDASLRIRFLRPLPSLLLWMEYKLGAGATLMHLHSLLWWALGAFAAWRLYVDHLSARASRLAVLMFALAPCQVVPIAWLANREALISLALSAWALRLYMSRGRSSSQTALAFGLACASGEYALGIGGYVIAYECLHRASIRERVVRAWPAALAALLYLAARSYGAYGSGGSGFYTDPLHAPLSYLQLAPSRFLKLMLEAWLSLDGEMLKSDVPILWVVVAIGALLLMLWSPLRAVLRSERALAVFLLGSVLCLVPMLAVVPSPRLLGMAMLGIAPLAAALLEQVWWTLGAAASHQARFAALLIGFSQLVHGPGTSWLMARSWQQAGQSFERFATELSGDLGDPTAASVTTVRGVAGAFFVPFALDSQGRPPRSWRMLSQLGHVLVLRKGERELELVAPAGQSLVPNGPGNLFRPVGSPFAVGDVAHAPGMKVTVLELGAQGIRRARFEFDRIDDTHFMVESHAGFKLVQLPDVGFGKPFEP